MFQQICSIKMKRYGLILTGVGQFFCYDNFYSSISIRYHCNLFVFCHYIWTYSEIYSSYSPNFAMKFVHNNTNKLLNICSSVKNIQVYGLIYITGSSFFAACKQTYHDVKCQMTNQILMQCMLARVISRDRYIFCWFMILCFCFLVFFPPILLT